jgi:exodeoxyribonuclease V alpha subunit
VTKINLHHLLDSGIFSYLDIHFARLMARLAGEEGSELVLGAALVSSRTRQGHICLDLSFEQGKCLLSEEGEGEMVPSKAPVICPKLDKWQRKLRETFVVGKPGEYKPLILDDRSRLYLYRYWGYETKLAESIKKRAGEDVPNVDRPLLKEGLNRLFLEGEEEVDWQKVAAFTALIRRFCVISGGPGTGKTTTVARILALLSEQAKSQKLHIVLAAPTGKAAARLQDAIRIAKDTLNCSESTKEAIPHEASTIHRLLGSIPGSPYFRHNSRNPLPADVVVVDEASMVDLALMSKLVQALTPETRLILLGDKDQLASVEVGAVLGDICDTGNVHSFSKQFQRDLKEVTEYDLAGQPEDDSEVAIQDCIVQLRKSYRFGEDSGIGEVSRAVNDGNSDLAVKLLTGGDCKDIKWKNLPRPDVLSSVIRDTVIKGFKNYLVCTDKESVFQVFDQFRILCALREGPYGVVRINSLVEEVLLNEKLIDPRKTWYRGRPVLITSNDYNLRLFNGDVGVTLPDPQAHNEPRIFFPDPDGTVRKFHPLRLPEHESVYAMTVHKSQGSEFDKVLLLLPDRESPVLSRELIYTGITRARESVEIWGTGEVFRSAISRCIERTSGLRDALWTV